MKNKKNYNNYWTKKQSKKGIYNNPDKPGIFTYNSNVNIQQYDYHV